jgi:ribose 1,5-bisphosphokinase PhnN
VIRKKREYIYIYKITRVKKLKERGRENQEQKFRRKRKKNYQIGGERENQILVILSVFSSLFPS